MKEALLIAALAAFLGTAPAMPPAIACQEEDLTQLSLEKLVEKLKTASKEERGKIVKELESRGVTVVEQTSSSGDEPEAGKEAKATLRTEYFDLKGPDKATLQKKAKELDALGKRFAEIFDATPKRGTIVFRKEARDVKEEKSGPVTVQVFSRLLNLKEKGDYWTLPWPLFEDEEGGSAKDMALDPERALTHEVMHILFVKYVAENFPDLKPRVTRLGTQVGTPLPDWLDEGLAVLAEPRDFREWRAKELAEVVEGAHPLAKELISLADLIAMDHPLVDGKGELINVFYGQSHALVDYLIRQGGAEVFRALIAGLAEDRSLEKLLADEKITRGKLPKTLKELEAALRNEITRRDD